MNLRKVTIGLSSIVLLWIVFFIVHTGPFDDIWKNIQIGVPFALMFCGFPQIVSIMISVHSKNPFSHILTMAASLAYIPCFACAIYIGFIAPASSTDRFIFLTIGFYSLPFLLPLWITAIVLEIRYRKKNVQKLESLEEQS
jgi:hypothetical protein